MSPTDTIDKMIQSIEIFRDAAENFKQHSRADREQDILSTIADILIDINLLEEELIPLGLVSGQTCRELKGCIDRMADALHLGPHDGLAYDLPRMHTKFTNNINFIRAHSTRQRKDLVFGRRLLSIDGGGVRGICSLLVLQALMKAIQAVKKGEKFRLEEDWDEKIDNDLPLPKDYFDLVGGTSTGGLIAIMLFRLGMPISQVKKKYDTLSRVIFKPGISRFLGGTLIKPLLNRPWFSGSKLEKEVEKVLREKGEQRGAMMQKDGVRCRAFVCAVTKYTHHTVNFRTYDPHDLTKSYHIPCSVVDAARATSAAPFYFPIKKIGKTTFWDGGLQNNNPICQVLGENGSEIPTVVVSLGTGIPRKVSARKVSVKISAKESQDTPNPPDFAELEGLENRKFSWPIVSQVQAVLEFVTNAENEHHSFERVLNSFQVPYYRLNPILTETVTLSDFGKMGDLVRDTKQYLEKEHARNMLVEIAELLLRPPPVDVLQEDDIIHPPSRRSSSS